MDYAPDRTVVGRQEGDSRENLQQMQDRQVGRQAFSHNLAAGRNSLFRRGTAGAPAHTGYGNSGQRTASVVIIRERASS